MYIHVHVHGICMFVKCMLKVIETTCRQSNSALNEDIHFQKNELPWAGFKPFQIDALSTELCIVR